MNPFRVLWEALYGVVENFTGMVGLTPLQVVVGLAAIVLLSIVYQAVLSVRGKTKFTLDDD